MSKKKAGVHYVDNKLFHEAILEYRRQCAEAEEAGTEKPRIPEFVGQCIDKIARKLATMPRFANYSFVDEMISDGIENCILYFHDFDPVKGQNPFSYFTQVIYYAFLRRIYKEERNRYTTYKNFQETVGLYTDFQLMEEEQPMYDKINSFMDKFEKREEVKKIKRKAAKEGISKFYEDK